MASPSQLETKLDRYYDDLMGKILEVLEAQGRILGEQKDIKKELSKLRETVLQTHSDLETLTLKIASKPPVTYGAPPEGGAAPSQVEAPPQPAPETTEKPAATVSASPTAAAPTEQTPAPEPAAAHKSRTLKDYLADEISIFDVKVLNAFIKATKEIVKANCRKEPAFIKPRVEAGISLPIIVAGKMNLTRDQGKGSMAVAFENHSAHTVARDMLFLDAQASLSLNDCKDVTSELCNQICGKSKILLKNDGYNFDISLPEVFAEAQPIHLTKKLGHPKIALVFEYEQMPFYVLFWG